MDTDDDTTLREWAVVKDYPALLTLSVNASKKLDVLAEDTDVVAVL